MQRIVESLLFFHPVVWWVSRWVRHEREACCDAVVVGRTNRPHAYAEMLVALAAQMPRSVLFHPAASSAMAAGPLRSRIRRILQLQDDPMLISGRSLTIALGSLAIVATVLVLYLPAQGSADESAAKSADLATESAENTESQDDKQSDDNFDDASQVRRWFQVDSQNPLQTRTYQVPTHLRKRLPDAFEGLRKDRFGPRVEFVDKWSGDGSQVTIVAPQAAQQALAHGFGLSLVSADAQDQPTAREWPDSLGPPPRVDRVIAEKAWQRLGLKLLPTTAEEREKLENMKQFPAGTKIVGGVLPADLPLPAYVWRLDGQILGEQMILGFDQLRLWLDSEDGESHAPVKCYALADGETYLLTLHPLKPQAELTQHVAEFQELSAQNSQPRPVVEHHRQIEMTTAGGERVLAESQDGRLRVQIRNRRTSRFPSLEEQKLADQAWKTLGLELERISDEDLQHVKAFGYDGGLKITGCQFGRYGVGENGIHEGDILVGLHVWPTTSFEAVIDVLNRGDLNELNPLKYYVVRPGSPGSGGFAPEVDTVLTGRIVAGPAVTGEFRPPKPKDGESLDVMIHGPPNDRYSAEHPMEMPMPMPLDAIDQNQGAFQARLMELARNQHQVEARIGEAAQRLEAVRGQRALLGQQLAKLQAEATADLPDGRKHKLAMQMDQLRQQIAGLREEAAKQTRAIQKHAEELQRNAERLKRDMEEQQRQADEQKQDAEQQAREAEKAEAYQRMQLRSHRESGVDVGPYAPAPPRAPPMPGQPPSVPAPMPTPNARLAPPAAPAPPEPTTGIDPLILPAPGADPNQSFQGTTTSAMPYLVRFEQGASRFLDGDNIKVLEIRGTAETFRPGNVYCIKGTYELGSHDRARLDAYTTAKDVANGTSKTWKIQTIVVNRGSGSFELFLPYSYDGWPHASFYPADGGEGFGGTYFGTGDSVLKKWSEVYGETDGSAPTPRTDENLLGGEEVPPASAVWGGRRDAGADFQGPEEGIVEFRSSKPDLRYEGGTFDDWRDEWRNELSPEKRLEAVKALTAFGRAGYGPQAAEAILDIAGQYDFDAQGKGTEKDLKQAIVYALIADGGSMVPYWLPDLAQRLEKDPQKWKGLARKLLMDVRSDNDQAIEVLQSLAESGPTDYRVMALRSLVQSSRMRSGGAKLDDRTLAILTQALHSKDPQTVYAATSFLFDGGNNFAYLSELVPLLFYPDANVRKHVRDMLHRLSAEDASQIEDAIISVLDDPVRQGDHIAAVRALGAMGNHAESAIPQLERILNDSVDVPLRVAAGFAIDKIEHGGRGRNRLLKLSDSTQDEKLQTRLARLFNEEQELQGLQ